MIFRRILNLTLSLVLLSSIAVAQNRANFAWWNSPLRADLNLTDAQNQKIRKIVRDYRPKLVDARAGVQKAEGDLEDLFNDEHVDPSANKALVERVALARAESSRVFTEMSIQLRAILSLDQWRLLVKRYGETQRVTKPSDTQVNP